MLLPYASVLCNYETSIFSIKQNIKKIIRKTIFFKTSGTPLMCIQAMDSTIVRTRKLISSLQDNEITKNVSTQEIDDALAYVHPMKALVWMVGTLFSLGIYGIY